MLAFELLPLSVTLTLFGHCWNITSAHCVNKASILLKFQNNFSRGLKEIERTQKVNRRKDGRRARHSTTRL